MANSTALVAQRLGAFLALLGVILGAFAAHGLKSLLLRNDTWEVWQTAVFYQFVHALAMLALGQGTSLRFAVLICWGIGVTLFSGSLYIIALVPDAGHWIGPITPLGGTLMIAGWIWLLVDLFNRKKNS